MLNKGLNFVPMAKKQPLEINLDTFIDAFRIKSVTETNGFFRSNGPLNKSENPAAAPIEAFLSSLSNKAKSAIQAANQKETRTNVSQSELKAILALKQDSDLVVKCADKGAGVVIQDRERYIQEGFRILNDTTNYKKLSEPFHPKHADTYLSILDQMLQSQQITRTQHRKLIPPTEYTERIIYFLPKIHKDRSKWINGNPPGRPIVSNCGSEGAAISTLLERIIQQRINSHNVPCVVKNSFEFLKDFRILRSELKNFPKSIDGSYRVEKILFVQADVADLYPSIPPDQALASLARCLRFDKKTKITGNDRNITIDSIMRLLRPQIYENDFLFEGQWFQQTKGIAMGQAWAPAIANLFLRDLDNIILSFHPKLYKRYIDDLILIWDKGPEKLAEMQTAVANWNKNIRLEWESGNEATFLDMKLFCENKSLECQVHFKETDSRRLLDGTSFHPSHTSKGVIKSQLLRYRRLCTRGRDATKATQSLFRILEEQGFKMKMLRKIEQEVLAIPNPDEPRPKKTVGIPLIALWDPRMTSVIRLLRSEFESFRANNPELEDMMPLQIFASWRSNKNLKNLIVRSKLAPLKRS